MEKYSQILHLVFDTDKNAKIFDTQKVLDFFEANPNNSFTKKALLPKSNNLHVDGTIEKTDSNCKTVSLVSPSGVEKTIIKNKDGSRFVLSSDGKNEYYIGDELVRGDIFCSNNIISMLFEDNGNKTYDRETGELLLETIRHEDGSSESYSKGVLFSKRSCDGLFVNYRKKLDKNRNIHYIAEEYRYYEDKNGEIKEELLKKYEVDKDDLLKKDTVSSKEDSTQTTGLSKDEIVWEKSLLDNRKMIFTKKGTYEIFQNGEHFSSCCPDEASFTFYDGSSKK